MFKFNKCGILISRFFCANTNIFPLDSNKKPRNCSIPMRELFRSFEMGFCSNIFPEQNSKCTNSQRFRGCLGGLIGVLFGFARKMFGFEMISKIKQSRDVCVCNRFLYFLVHYYMLKGKGTYMSTTRQ